MKITPQSGIMPIRPMERKERAAADGAAEKSHVEESEVSNAAQLLSRNQSQLKNHLSTREEVIQRFSGNLHDPVKLHDRTIDLIIQRMKNT